MSWIKKALEKARDERMGNQSGAESVAESGPRPAPAPVQDFPEPVYARTRIIPVSRDELIKKRIVALDQHSGVSDQFKLLRTRVFHRSRVQGWNTIQVSGFNKGEGKTLVAANLAVCIAQDARQTTLLVDLDLRSPSLHQLLGLGEKTPGLKAYFQEGAALEELFINPGIEKLTVLLAGGRMAEAPEIMGSPRMEALVKELKHRYSDRYIIFDTPPINECPDPLVFSEYVDALVLVARADSTTVESIQAAMNLVPRQKVLGVVLNDSRWEEIQNYYYYGYSARG
jgi:protein-tyrosine kinase